jgi:hypothetical protein
MSISAIDGVSGSRQSLLNMAHYSLFSSNDAMSQPQPQPPSTVSALMQVLLQTLQQGRGNMGQGGGGQRGGGFQGGCQGGPAEAAQSRAGAEAAEGADETLGSVDLDEGAHGLLDAISGLLAAIGPLFGETGDDAGGEGGGGHWSANDDAFNVASLLRANGF